MRPSWLTFTYHAQFRLDAGNPTWAASVLKEVRLPRWTYEAHDRGAAVFSRAPQRLPEGRAEARLRLLPSKPMPKVSLEVAVHGRWRPEDEDRRPPPSVADIIEEAEALLVLLGCRSPRFFHDSAERWR